MTNISLSKLEKDNLKKELILTQNAIDTAKSNLNYALDPDLIDCYIYQVKSEEYRYKFLLKRARELSL